MTAPDTLHGLKRQRPEWEPWLAVIEEIVRETASPRWDASVPADVQPRPDGPPLVAGAMLAVPANSVRRLLKRLIRVASLSASPNIASLDRALDADLDVLTLFNASLCQNSDRIEEVAAARGADPTGLQAVAALVPVPLLHACNRRWAASISRSWVEGYCPVCGAWPAFAEVRGIERTRIFRCGRCGGEWHARLLSCPYCTEGSHDALVSLVPENGESHGTIDACTSCHGYVKTFTRLRGCEPDTVMLEDLASVHFDVAALEQGYTRPSGAGYPLEVSVTDEGATRRFFGWKP
ncbi:MAG TPA: formate dehydrogenase accessory protein FdhE [Vicinamibacterales bacterium]|nr:formate dehydrogenase accessory protein FdhE [Vicinamibacterales bacterium]